MQGCVGREESIPMPVRRSNDGRWRYREVIRLPDGTRERINGTAPKHTNTKAGAQQALRDHIERILQPESTPTREEVLTFDEWFNGRFWHEWVVGRRNKPTEVRSKQIIYACHLKPFFGALPLDRIGVGEVARFRASLVEKGLSDKRINNILSVLSKPLRYAMDCQLVKSVPKIGLFKVERPEIEALGFDEYARMLEAAQAEGAVQYAALCLAGEAGLRVGEVKALRWREDVDLVAGTLTVNRQICHGEATTPKGRTRRTIPMTSRLLAALRGLEVVREGLVVRERDGSGWTDSEADKRIRRVCRRAGLPERGWHPLRHTFGTHAAMFGVNPWRLQAWMGHKRIDETMLYVHVAEGHRRELPIEVIDAGDRERDPDRRILAMLGARGKTVANLEGGLEKAV